MEVQERNGLLFFWNSEGRCDFRHIKVKQIHLIFREWWIVIRHDDGGYEILARSEEVPTP